MFCNLENNYKQCISFQTTIKYRKIFISFVGVFLPINLLTVVCINNDLSLLIAPFGASKVLVIGAEKIPLAYPRNLIMGNLFGAISDIFHLVFLITILFLAEEQLELR